MKFDDLKTVRIPQFQLFSAKGVYVIYIIKRPILGDLENVLQTINNQQFYILRLFFFIAWQSISLYCPQFVKNFSSKFLHFVQISYK